MAQKEKSTKKARGNHAGRLIGSTIKTGNRGAKRTRLTEQQKVLMGKGAGKKLQNEPGYTKTRTYGNGIKIPS